MMEPLVQSVVILFTAFFSICVNAYPNGLITDSCSSMLPNHGGATAQTTSTPYTLTLSKSTYSAGGDLITVTLGSPSNSQFKGFLIEARSGSDTTPLGSFQVSGSAQTLTCTTTASAVSHISNSAKTSVQMTWVAPASTTKDIVIRATVLQSYSVFWNVVSGTLSFAGPSSSTSSSTVSTTTTTPHSTGSTSSTTPSSAVSTSSTTSRSAVSSSTTTPSSAVSTSSTTSRSAVSSSTTTPSSAVSTLTTTPYSAVSSSTTTPSSAVSTSTTTPHSAVSSSTTTPHSATWTYQALMLFCIVTIWFLG